MPNQAVVRINNLSRLVADNDDYENGNGENFNQSRLNTSNAFYVEQDTSNGYSISLHSLQNDLFVCLDGNKLAALCNESIKDQRRDDFAVKCFSNWRGNLRRNSDCKVFLLYSQTANKLVTIDASDPNDKNVLKVLHCFRLVYSNIIYQCYQLLVSQTLCMKPCIYLLND